MLIAKQIDRARPRDRAYRLADQGGLYCMVTPAGGRLWRYKYRFQRSEKLMALGAYPDVSLAAARERHQEARALLATGVDPMADRREQQQAVAASTSFQTIGALWLKHWRKDKSERHVDVTARRLLANVYPHIGLRSIDEVQAIELVTMVQAIEARGVGDLAKRALETCGQIFRYGVAHGHCERNPVADFKPGDVLAPRVRTNLARVSEAQLPGLLRAIEVYDGSVLTRLAMKLMAHTFVRTSELIGAEWEEVDQRWNIPAARMKMKTPHIVPLSRQAVEILHQIRLVSGRQRYLFPGAGAVSGTMSNNTILQALRRMGYGGTMTGHGFRGVASTILHEQGWEHEWIEIQLAHAPRNAVSAAYNHALYLQDRHRMMQAWGDYLEGVMRK